MRNTPLSHYVIAWRNDLDVDMDVDVEVLRAQSSARIIYYKLHSLTNINTNI